MKVKKLFVDLETTGVDDKKHGIIQLAAILVYDWTEKATINITMQPFPQDEILESALEVTGKTREEIATYKSPRMAYVEFKAFLDRHVQRFNKKDKLFFIGYNARFDDGFLRAWFEKNEDKYYGAYFFWPPIDMATIVAEEHMDTRHEFENFRLTTVASKMGIECDELEAHDAMYDARLTMAMYNKVRGRE